MSVPGIVSSPGLIGQPAPIIWSLVGNTYSNDSSTINYPSGIQAGDIIVFIDKAVIQKTSSGAVSPPSNVVPSGITQIVSNTIQISSGGFNKTSARLTSSIRRATSQLSGSITGMLGGSGVGGTGGHTRKCMAVFRGSSPFTGMVISGVSSDTGTDATSDSIPSGSGISPLMVLAFSSWPASELSLTNYSGRFGPGNPGVSMAWRFFNSNEIPINCTATLSTASTGNILQTCFVQCTTT